MKFENRKPTIQKLILYFSLCALGSMHVSASAALNLAKDGAQFRSKIIEYVLNEERANRGKGHYDLTELCRSEGFENLTIEDVNKKMRGAGGGPLFATSSVKDNEQKGVEYAGGFTISATEAGASAFTILFRSDVQGDVRRVSRVTSCGVKNTFL